MAVFCAINTVGGGARVERVVCFGVGLVLVVECGMWAENHAFLQSLLVCYEYLGIVRYNLQEHNVLRRMWCVRSICICRSRVGLACAVRYAFMSSLGFCCGRRRTRTVWQQCGCFVKNGGVSLQWRFMKDGLRGLSVIDDIYHGGFLSSYKFLIP